MPDISPFFIKYIHVVSSIFDYLLVFVSRYLKLTTFEPIMRVILISWAFLGEWSWPSGQGVGTVLSSIPTLGMV